MKNDNPQMPVKKREVKLGKSFKAAVLRWHRNIGIAIAILILVFALSGIALNHTEGLSLDKKFIQSNWLLDWYGISIPEEFNAFQFETGWAAQIGQRTFLNGLELKAEAGKLLGVASLNDLIIVAFEQEILLLTEQGDVMDNLSTLSGLPTPVHALAVNNDVLWIRTEDGIYQSDEDFFEWLPHEEKNLPWTRAKQPSNEIKNQFINLYRGNGLTYERVMLDLHSGRILGQWGVWLMDLAAVLLIVMSLTGVWLWVKQKRKNQSKQAK